MCKLHGLRMLDPRVFAELPLASADSCGVARNLGLDCKWNTGYLRGLSKPMRAVVIADRCDSHATAPQWSRAAVKQQRFSLE